MFAQILDPLGSGSWSTLVAFLPLTILLVFLAGLRLPAWPVAIVAGAFTVGLAVLVWGAPLGHTVGAYGLGVATGMWSVNWIVLWGVLIYNTMVSVGAVAGFRNWLIEQAGGDVRVQTLVIAWGFGALLEGLVGFGYPWALVAPILIAIGIDDLSAIRVAALANNAPVSFGALGAPVVALAAVTALPVASLSSSIGILAAALAVVPPFLLIYLVSGWRGLRAGWVLGLVASVGFIAGQLPTALFLGPYLPSVVGSLTCLLALLAWVRWRPPTVSLAFGGRDVAGAAPGRPATLTPLDWFATGSGPAFIMDPAAPPERPRPRRLVLRRRRAVRRGVVPFLLLVAIVVAWTGPWSPLPTIAMLTARITAVSSLGGAPVAVTFTWTPFVAGSAIAVAWVVITAYLRPTIGQLRTAVRASLSQLWGAMLVAPLLFGLAAVFNFSGMANTLASGLATVGPAYLLLAPVLGWIAVGLSGSNTSAGVIFGSFQLTVGRLLGAPLLLFPALNSLGAVTGKPVAPQTVSVGIATTKLVRHEGHVIRNNLPATLVLLAYAVLISLAANYLVPGLFR